MRSGESAGGEGRLLGAQAAARHLGIHRSTLHLAVRRGALVPDERTPGGHLRFTRATLDAYRDRAARDAAPGGEAQVRAMRAIGSVTRGLVAGDSLARVAEAAAGGLLGALPGLDGCFIALVTPQPGDPHALQVVARCGMPPQIIEEFLRLRRTFRFAATTTVRTLEAEVREDAETEPLHTGTRHVSRLWRVGAYAAYPIAVDDRPLGALLGASHRPRRFSPAERAFLQALADLLALAMRLEAPGQAQSPASGR